DIGRFQLVVMMTTIMILQSHPFYPPRRPTNEVIKSSVKDLIPIPSEFKGIPDTMYDVHFNNNHTPLEAKDHVEIVMNSNDDISSSDDGSLHEENISMLRHHLMILSSSA
nr:hypothetical protein [Tanacetum cinerariifolium]